MFTSLESWLEWLLGTTVFYQGLVLISVFGFISSFLYLYKIVPIMEPPIKLVYPRVPFRCFAWTCLVPHLFLFLAGLIIAKLTEILLFPLSQVVVISLLTIITMYIFQFSLSVTLMKDPSVAHNKTSIAYSAWMLVNLLVADAGIYLNRFEELHQLQDAMKVKIFWDLCTQMTLAIGAIAGVSMVIVWTSEVATMTKQPVAFTKTTALRILVGSAFAVVGIALWFFYPLYEMFKHMNIG